MKSRAGIYARNSVDKKDSTTIDDQLRMCRGYARERGTLVLEFTDPGISGMATANRLGFLAMAAAKVRDFVELLLMDMTRFSHNAGDCNKALDRLDYQRICVHDASKEISSNADTFRTLIVVDDLVSSQVVKAASKKSYYNLLGRPTAVRLPEDVHTATAPSSVLMVKSGLKSSRHHPRWRRLPAGVGGHRLSVNCTSSATAPSRAEALRQQLSETEASIMCPSYHPPNGEKHGAHNYALERFETRGTGA